MLHRIVSDRYSSRPASCGPTAGSLTRAKDRRNNGARMGRRRQAPSPPGRGRATAKAAAHSVGNSPLQRNGLLAAVLAGVFVSFLPALQAGFVWDDADYVRTNETIRSLDADRILSFFAAPQQGNYHPLTILSLAIDYALGGLDPFGYHLVNVLLHVANTLLVHRLVSSLSRREDVALTAAAFWGIHPLRVESVAWVSGRKDLLYTAFFVISLLLYRRYSGRASSPSAYFASLGAYVLSLLSKGMAVSLALVLPLSDFLDRRRLAARSVLDKLPFLALALAFGWIALVAQQGAGGLKEPRPLADRLAVAAYGSVAYLGKTALPVELSAFYPYPGPPGDPLPLSYRLAPVAVLALAAAVALSLRRTRKIAFGLGFYLANVAFVLQVVPVGAAVMADRYTYLSSVGLAFLAGEGLARARDALAAAGRVRRLGAVALLLAGLAVLGTLTWQRCGVWRDNLSLWNDVLSKHPDSAIAYNNRGNARADLGDRLGAARDYEQAIRLQPDFVLALYNQAYLAGEEGDFARAAEGFSRVLELAPEMLPARVNRADAYVRLGRPEDAIRDYDRVLAVEPGWAPAYAGRARAWADLGEQARAVEDARRARALGFELDPQLVRRLQGGGTLPLATGGPP